MRIGLKKVSQGCKGYEKVYIGNTKFNVITRMNKHKKEVEYQRINNAVAKHVQETNYEINWKEAEFLERRKNNIL